MGLFDKMFGRGATAAMEAPNATKRFEELKARYAPVLTVIQQENVRLLNLHVDSNRLFLRGIAPSDAAKAKVDAKIQEVGTADIIPDIRVEAPAPPPATSQTHVVVSGDTLSKIAKKYYGDANEYMRIFYANREQLKDPDKIQVGQKLVIPPDTDD